jgi:sulfatase maturation enzyme AslB (radical SAM superfamily)
LLDYPLIRRALEYLRTAAGIPLSIYIFTNGTQLHPDRMRFLLRHGVRLVVSLPHEILTMRHPRTSAPHRYITAWKKFLARCDDRAKSSFEASFVFGPSSTAWILNNIDTLYRTGFRKIGFSPDITSLWSAGDLLRLDMALKGFARYYKVLLNKGLEPFEISNIHEPLAKALGHKSAQRLHCEHLFFAADGRFYACDKMLCLPFAQLREFSIGSPSTGLNQKLRLAHFKEASNSMRDIAGANWHACHCPVGVYSLWKLKSSGSRDKLATSLKSFRQVSKILWANLYRLAQDMRRDPEFLKIHHV